MVGYPMMIYTTAAQYTISAPGQQFGQGQFGMPGQQFGQGQFGMPGQQFGQGPYGGFPQMQNYSSGGNMSSMQQLGVQAFGQWPVGVYSPTARMF